MADVNVPEEDIGTFTTNVSRVSDEYTKPFSSERRIAEFGIKATDDGFKSSISVYRRTEGGGSELVYEKSVPTTELAKAITELNRLRQEAGVPGSDIGRIQAPDDRATKTRDPFKGPKPPEPKPEDRSIAGTPENRPNPPPGDAGPVRDPADRADGLGPEVPGPPESISAPSDVADWYDYQVGQWERATASWRDPLELGLKIMFPLPGTNPADVRETAQGFVDVLRFGKGTAQGTTHGVIEDINRALSVFPETKGVAPVLRAVSTAATAASVGETVVVVAVGVVSGLLPNFAAAFPKDPKDIAPETNPDIDEFGFGHPSAGRHSVIQTTEPSVRIRSVTGPGGETIYRFEYSTGGFRDSTHVPLDMRVSRNFKAGEAVPENIEWLVYKPHVNDGKSGWSLLKNEFIKLFRRRR